MPTYGSANPPTNTYCVDGVCHYTYGSGAEVAVDAEGNIIGVENYGSIPTGSPPASVGGGSIYPGDVVPPSTIGTPTPPAVVTSVPPTPGGVVTMEDSAFITDGEIRSTGWLSPNVVTQREVSGATWERPTATMVVDGDTSTITDPNGTQIVARDFRANIPIGAAVVGIDVEVNGRYLTVDTTDEDINLIRCGGLTETGGGGCGLSGSFEAWSVVSGTPAFPTIEYLGSVSDGVLIGGFWYNPDSPWETRFQAFNPVTMAYDIVSIPGVTTSVSQYDLPIVQANGRLYVINASTGDVHLYSAGAFTTIGTISGGLTPYDADHHVTVVISGREQVYFPYLAKRLEFPTDSTMTVHSVSNTYDFDTARFWVGYQDKMLAVNGAATSAFLYDPVSNTTTAVSAPPSGYFKSEPGLAFQLSGEANTSVFYSVSVLVSNEWSIATYCHTTDTWANPFTFSESDTSGVPGYGSGTTRLIGGAYYVFSNSALFKADMPTATGGVSSVLTPVNLPNYDEGRVLPGDLGTYTCELIPVKTGSADLTTALIAREYEGPAVAREFVNDPSFGVTYALTTTGDSSAAIDSIRINVRYVTEPFADVVPPALAGANGYTSVAISQDGSTITAVGVDGLVSTAPISDTSTWTPVALPPTIAARDIYGVTYTRDGLIFVGESGLVYANGVQKVGTTENFTSIAYDYLTETTVITGTGSGVVNSADSGTSFTYNPGAAELPITYASTIAPTAIVRVGADGMILRSYDGVNWMVIESGTTNDLYDVHFAGINMVAVGEAGTILYSGDGGQTWTQVASGTTSDLYTVSGASNVFIAAGAGGVMLQSQNAGYTWTPMTSGTTSDLRGSAVSGGTYVVVGDESTIISGALTTDLLDVTDGESGGISDSFDVTMHYDLTLSDDLLGRADEDRNVLELIDESYEAFEMGFAPTLVLDEDIGEDAEIHVGMYTNPHFLDEVLSITDTLVTTYGATVTFDDILDGSDSTATLMTFVLMMSEDLNITHALTSSMMLTLALDESMTIDDIMSGGLHLSLTIDEALIVGTITTGLDTTDETNWNCWVMNTETKDVTRYTNFRFTSMAQIGEQVFATNGTKIYMLGGDTDAGANINAEIELPISDFNDSHLKNVNRVYLGLWADGRMALKTITEGLTERWYSLDAPTAGLHELRVPLPKGVRARYWSFKIGNELGSDFTLDSVTLLPIVLSRRTR